MAIGWRHIVSLHRAIYKYSHGDDITDISCISGTVHFIAILSLLIQDQETFRSRHS